MARQIHEKVDLLALTASIKKFGQELGFQQLGITGIQLDEDESRLMNWLEDGMHGEMHYMERHGTKRSRPSDLLPGTLRIISARMDYLPATAADTVSILNDPLKGFISRYATGRDYHKLIRQRLKKLVVKIEQITGKFGYRAFVDSAPVLEKPLARNAGLGWIGKHSNLINPGAGSWFFLGEIYTDLPLPVDPPFSENHCGSCTACMDICPTGAIVAPYRVDARRCISYLTIELRGAIPVEFRKLIGNRIYGCDDCQLICPWNKFAQHTPENDFKVRHKLDKPDLIDLFKWTEEEFNRYTEGSAIRRIGYDCWLRNIAVALGNVPKNKNVVNVLNARMNNVSDLVQEHITWALSQHQ